MKRISFIVILLSVGAAGHAQEDGERGYWKFHVPELNKPFGNDDVVALAQGKHVVTDCSVPWIGGDGNTYCFKDVASREVFLHAPMDYYRQALQVQQRERGGKSQSSNVTVPLNEVKAAPAFAVDTKEKTRC